MAGQNEKCTTLPDASTKLAMDRTRFSYERTLTSWIRTATSIITFGFSIYNSFRLSQQVALREVIARWSRENLHC
jgi:uncharacterized membrane protein YidH (DUF202 family)